MYSLNFLAAWNFNGTEKKDPIILASAHAQLGAPLNSYFSTSAWLAACRGCGLLGGENKFNLNGED
jgi:hypothetical protein